MKKLFLALLILGACTGRSLRNKGLDCDREIQEGREEYKKYNAREYQECIKGYSTTKSSFLDLVCIDPYIEWPAECIN